jgi:RNA polymerase sigma-70 factor (ECF subfamily)
MYDVFVFSTACHPVSLSFPDPLLERAQAGDADAFCELVHPLETRLVRQAWCLCGDASQAEDLAQETLAEGWKSLRRFNGQCQLFTWLCAILLNRHRNGLRVYRPITLTALDGTDCDGLQRGLENVPDPAALPSESLQQREHSELVRRCIAALPEKQQQVIFFRFYVDDSIDGIAAALGCSPGTVKSRLFNALERLRGMNALNRAMPFSESEVKTP